VTSTSAVPLFKRRTVAAILGMAGQIFKNKLLLKENDIEERTGAR